MFAFIQEIFCGLAKNSSCWITYVRLVCTVCEKVAQEVAAMRVSKFAGGVSIIAIAICLGVLTVYAKLPPVVQGAPDKDSGVTALQSQSVDLQSGYERTGKSLLRMRLLTIRPGGYTGIRSHENRPAVFYVIKGATTVIYGDGTAKRFSKGSMGYATRNAVHWHRNNEKVPVVLVVTDIYQRAKK